jgi:hypothetical protein
MVSRLAISTSVSTRTRAWVLRASLLRVFNNEHKVVVVSLMNRRGEEEKQAKSGFKG